MNKIMDMIYTNSTCASVYFQVFDMNNLAMDNLNAKDGSPIVQNTSKEGSPEMRRKRHLERAMTKGGNHIKEQALGSFHAGEYMYVEMAHYTDDDTVVLICVTNINNFEVHEYKLEKLKDKHWEFII